MLLARPCRAPHMMSLKSKINKIPPGRRRRRTMASTNNDRKAAQEARPPALAFQFISSIFEEGATQYMLPRKSFITSRQVQRKINFTKREGSLVRSTPASTPPSARERQMISSFESIFAARGAPRNQKVQVISYEQHRPFKLKNTFPCHKRFSMPHFEDAASLKM